MTYMYFTSLHWLGSQVFEISYLFELIWHFETLEDDLLDKELDAVHPGFVTSSKSQDVQSFLPRMNVSAANTAERITSILVLFFAMV